MKLLSILILIWATSLSLGCAEFDANFADKLADIKSPAIEPPDGIDSPKPPEVPPNVDEPLAICSELTFKDVTWPADFGFEDRNAMALALNVSGSYEGHSGWANLTNNFDGQGISMGLLQQNFGQGSIQPLFVKLRDQHPQVLTSFMTPVMLNSFLAMLSDWEKAQSLLPQTMLTEAAREEVEPSRYLLSHQELAENNDIQKFYGFSAEGLAPHNRKSVEWAKRTVFTKYNGKRFKKEWRRAFKKIAGHPAYISLQIEAARHLHDRAWGYQKRLGFTELRGYLFLFDIAVQNGTLRQKHFNKFFAWRKKNPNAGEEKQMLELLEIRVKDSKPQWRDDVRRRKRATIRGVGKVHGRNRDLQNEFCYDQHVIYP